jgi:drug/metabolite transporter (DMT)-like permease
MGAHETMRPPRPLPAPATRRATTGVLLALAAATAFAFKAIFVKLAFAEGLDAIGFLTLRMLVAAPFFVGLLFWRGGVWPTRREMVALAVLGLAGFYLAAVLDFSGLAYLSAGLERIVLYTHPTFIVLFAALREGAWPAPRALVAIAVAWLGLLLAAGGDLSGGVPLADLRVGIALVGGSSLAYAAYLLGVEGLGQRLGAIRVAAIGNLVATVAIAAHGWLVHPDLLDRITPRVAGLALVVGTVSTVLPGLLLAAAIDRIGPGTASTLGMIGPVLAGLLGYAVLGEPLSAAQLLGGLVVGVGVSLARPRPQAPDARVG